MTSPRTLVLLVAWVGSAWLVSPGPTPAAAAESSEPQPASPLAFLEPFVGAWLPHPEWEPLKEAPHLRTLVPLNLRWGGDMAFLEMSEGLRSGGGYATSGIVLWNHTVKRAEFLAKQIDGDLVFEGHYESLGPRTARRVYDVIRPDGSVDRYRETFDLTSDTEMDWTTERWVDGRYENVRGVQGPEFRAVRPSAAAAELESFATLIGSWTPDPHRPGSADAEYQTFEWGPAKQWIEYREYRRRGDSDWRQEAAGLIAWDPSRRLMAYRKQAAGGVAHDGVLDRVDAETLALYSRSAHPDGSIRMFEETWKWEGGEGGCFERIRVERTISGRTSSQPRRVCRRTRDGPAGRAHPR